MATQAFQNNYHKSIALGLTLITGIIFSSPALASKLNISLSDLNGNKVHNAVIFIDGIKPDASDLRTDLTIIQKKFEFIPNVLGVKLGETVYFPNKDKTKHSIYSVSKSKKMKIDLYKGSDVPTEKFDKVGPVIMGCKIHDWMVGYIYVVDSKYVTQTKKNGLGSLILSDDLNDQKIRIGVWHPQIRKNKPKYFKYKMKNENNNIRLQITLTN